MRYYSEKYSTLAVEGYKFYRSLYPKHFIRPDRYSKVGNEFLKLFVQKVLDGNDVRFGSKLGIVGVRGRKIKICLNKDGKITLPIDWGRTRKLWIEKAKELKLTWEQYLETIPKEERELRYHFNDHSNNVRYRISWYKSGVTAINKTYYTLDISRSTSDKLSKLIMSGKEYLIVPEKISKNELKIIEDRIKES